MNGRDPVRLARLVLGTAILVLAAFLLLAPKPWDVPTGPAFFGTPERPLRHAVAIGLWWAAALNLLFCATLLATAPLWARRPPEPDAPVRPARLGRGTVLCLAAAALLAFGMRWNLAHTGLWSDEAWSVRHVIAGIVKPDRKDPSQLKRRTVSLNSMLWRYEQPTNQVLYSVLARPTLAAWRAATGRPSPDFDEFVLRLPALLAASAAVVAIGLLLAAWGYREAGVAAAFLLAIHPWYVQWGASGRSYSLAVLLQITATLLVLRAVQSGAWRAWWAYGATVFCLLWAHLFSAYAVASLAAGAAVAVATGPGLRATRRVRIGRLVAVHAVAGALVFQLMAPNLSQLGQWQGIFFGQVESARLTPAAVGHLWSLASVGVVARAPEVPERADGAYPSLADWPARGRWWTYPVVLGLAPLAIALGGLALLARGGAVRWLALGLAGGVPLALFVNWLNEDQWYPRFGIYALPVTVGFAAVGLQAALARLPRPRLAVPCGLAIAVLLFQLFVWDETRILLTRPHQPSREVAESFDRHTDGQPLAAIRAVFSHVDGGITRGLVPGGITLPTYDPWVRVPVELAEVDALCREAAAAGKPLYFAYSHPARNRNRHPDVFRFVDDPAYFEPLEHFDAVEVEHLFRVLRWTGRPLTP